MMTCALSLRSRLAVISQYQITICNGYHDDSDSDERVEQQVSQEASDKRRGTEQQAI